VGNEARDGLTMPSMQRLICLLCDSPGPLRRLKPEQLYACDRCVRTHGGAEAILSDVAHHIVEFNRRHEVYPR
jgi:hypothetical protein